MNAYKITLHAVVIAAGCLLAGCASTTTPHLDQHFGEAVKAARAQQTINPDASKNPDPVAGVDGRAAKDGIDRYHKSFENPPATFNVLNIGGSSSSGQQ